MYSGFHEGGLRWSSEDTFGVGLANLRTRGTIIISTRCNLRSVLLILQYWLLGRGGCSF